MFLITPYHTNILYSSLSVLDCTVAGLIALFTLTDYLIQIVSELLTCVARKKVKYV